MTHVTEADHVPEDVKQFFIDAYVRGWNLGGHNVSLEKGVAMMSYRRDKDKWCEDVVHQIETKYPNCLKVDIPCLYHQGDAMQTYDPWNDDHKRHKQQYPKCLQVRTHPDHAFRLLLLRNIDVFRKGLANGVALRILASNPWSEHNDNKYKGRQDVNTGKWTAHKIDLQKQNDFTLLS